MKKRKVLFILSHIDKALAFEWISKYIDSGRFEIEYVLLTNKKTEIEVFLYNNGIRSWVIPYRGKWEGPIVLIKLIFILLRIHPKVVHTHLFDAGFWGLTAARILRIPNRIYTRHYSDLHHKYFPKSVWLDRWINHCATSIVAISQVVKRVLVEKEGVSVTKIKDIPHGFDLKYFHSVDPHRIESLKKSHSIPENANPVIGVIARYTHWKGIQDIIEAFQDVKVQFPKAHLVLANAHGDYENEIKTKLREIEGAYSEVVFENDIAALYKVFDVYVHVPINSDCEAFGQTYVESLASGVPSVFTLSGIAREFIVDEQNALTVAYQCPSCISESVIRLLNDELLRKKLISNGAASVESYFHISSMISSLEQLYME